MEKSMAIQFDIHNKNQYLEFEKLFTNYLIEIGFNEKESGYRIPQVATHFANLTIKSENSWIVLIYEKSNCIGFSFPQVIDFNKDTYFTCDDAKNEKGFYEWAFLREFYIMPAFRKRGFSRVLYDATLNLIKYC